ncbi:MAG: hypothetical protein KC983_03395 [Phycisphaerales bacterium]|nr:hypothetical protein [Phycisphaerales bacterium]
MTSPILAATETESMADLRTRVTELEQELSIMKRAAGEEWLTEQRAEAIRGLVADVLADADTRASFADGMTGYYDGGAIIQSADGSFRLKVNGQMQVRFNYNRRDTSAGGVDPSIHGFENRRTKLKFTGHVWDKTWQYAITGAFDRDGGTSGGSFRLEDAFIKKQLENNTYVRMGQFKLPFAREELVSSSKQLLAERSLINEEFNQDFAQGIELGWTGEQVRVFAAFSDGFASRNSAALTMPISEYAFTGRAEVLLGGTWKQFDDFTSMPGSTNEVGVMLGGAAHYQMDDYGTVATEVERFTWTLDGSVEGDGWNAFASFTGNHLSSMGAMDIDQYGVVVQGGLFINDKNELFARYEWGDDDSTSDDLSVITVGMNSYYYKHNLKSTIDVGYALNEVASTWSSSSAGWRTTGVDEDGQLVVRAQLQLLF